MIIKHLLQVSALFLVTSISFAGSIPKGQLSSNFSKDAGGNRSYYVTLPKDYNPQKKYKLVMAFAGTHSTGQEMREWFGLGWNDDAPGLEKNMKDTIFIYPDQKWRWGSDRGWALGPNGDEFGGLHDIKFTEELLALVKRTYSIDSNKVFAIGHSWGGDMTAVVGCFLGNNFRAIAPVAANRPYWFENSDDTLVKCQGKPAVWTVFGLSDTHFDKNDNYRALFGKQQNEFWLNNHGCSAASGKKIGKGTTEYTNCKVAPVRFTLFKDDEYSGGGDTTGHYPPDYFLKDVSNWFQSFN